MTNYGDGVAGEAKFHQVISPGIYFRKREDHFDVRIFRDPVPSSLSLVILVFSLFLFLCLSLKSATGESRCPEVLKITDN